jgi:hypothetical protein
MPFVDEPRLPAKAKPWPLGPLRCAVPGFAEGDLEPRGKKNPAASRSEPTSLRCPQANVVLARTIGGDVVEPVRQLAVPADCLGERRHAVTTGAAGRPYGSEGFPPPADERGTPHAGLGCLGRTCHRRSANAFHGFGGGFGEIEHRKVSLSDARGRISMCHVPFYPDPARPLQGARMFAALPSDENAPRTAAGPGNDLYG